MSDSTPCSYVDDGVDIEARIPKGGSAWDIDSWAEHVADSGSTIDTASYMDDGRDLLPATGIGFGAPIVDTDAQHRKRAEKKYHPGMQKAVSAQIGNMLAGVKAMGQVKVCEREKTTQQQGQIGNEDKTGEKKENAPPGAVRIRFPAPPPMFIIHDGKGGDVLVIDEDGEEFDSRMPEGLRLPVVVEEPEPEKPPKEEKRDINQMSPPHLKNHPSNTQNQEKQQKEQKNDDNKKKQRKQQKKGNTTQQQQPKPPSKRSEALPKPTNSPAPGPNFMMSGALNGWPPLPAPSQAGSNYRAPTVEDTPATPQKEDEGKSKYKNGYDEPYETYCNAVWVSGNTRINVRVGNWGPTW
jgi:hypothetical protein